MKKDKDIFDRIMEWKILSIFNPFYKKYKEVLLYLFFGGLTTFISIGSYAFFDIGMHMDPMIANIFSWILAVLFAYITNRIWVFDSNAEDMNGILKEMVSVSATLNKRIAANTQTIPTGKLIKKIQCQDRLSLIRPPKIGPKIGPTTVVIAHRPIACACFS